MPIMPLKERYDDNRDGEYSYGNSKRSRRTRSRSKLSSKEHSHIRRSRRSRENSKSKYSDESQKQNHDSKQSINNKKYTTRIDKNENHCHSKTSSNNNHHHNKQNGKSSVKEASCRRRRSDDVGHLEVSGAGACLDNGRYAIKEYIGKGTFGQVFDCHDRKHKERVAVKVVRNKEKYSDAALEEAQILKYLNRADPEKKHHIIPLVKCFPHLDHVCLSFPKLGKSVYQYMKSNSFQPYTLPQVQHISRQLLDSVCFLHKMKITHTDLKPENILFDDSSYISMYNKQRRMKYMYIRNSNIHVIDLGSAIFDDRHHSSTIQTRHYRAPEVVLGNKWYNACDVWSCGCIIFEIFTGETLFLTHDNREHLAMMEKVLGQFPQDLLREVSSSTRSRFFRDDKVDYPSDVSFVQPLAKYMKPSSSEPVEQLHDLLKKLLAHNPKNRFTASEALKHPFFDHKIEENISITLRPSSSSTDKTYD